MFRLFPFFLLSVLVALAMPADADSVYGSASGGDLIGAFDGQLNGHFVSVTADSFGATIQIPGSTIVLEKALGTATITGPLADFGDVQIHDNAYGWIHIQGDFRVQASNVQEAPNGLVFDSLFLVSPSGLDWSHDGTWLTVSAVDTLISNDDSFQRLGPQPGAWALLEQQAEPVMDWFAFHGAPFATQAIDDDVAMNFVGTLGADQPDLLIRLEERGFFEPTPEHFIFRLGSLAAQRVEADDMLLPRGGFTFTAMKADHNIVHLRLPEGMSGQARWQQDLTPPNLLNSDATNIDPYAPLVVVPELHSTWSEPVRGELRIGGQVKQTINPATELRFRLTGLQPETTYNYTLEVRDLAGNVGTHQGLLTTGAREGPTAKINVLEVTDQGSHKRVKFAAELADGTPASVEQIQIFIDKQAVPGAVSQAAEFQVDVPPGAKEIRIEVVTPNGRVSEVVTFDGGEDAPLPWWLLPVALAIARRR